MLFVLQTPSGVICPGRKNTKALPQVAPYFSFTVEILDKSNKEVYFMNVSSSQLVSIDVGTCVCVSACVRVIKVMKI